MERSRIPTEPIQSEQELFPTGVVEAPAHLNFAVVEVGAPGSFSGVFQRLAQLPLQREEPSGFSAWHGSPG